MTLWCVDVCERTGVSKSPESPALDGEKERRCGCREVGFDDRSLTRADGGGGGGQQYELNYTGHHPARVVRARECGGARVRLKVSVNWCVGAFGAFTFSKKQFHFS